MMTLATKSDSTMVCQRPHDVVRHDSRDREGALLEQGARFQCGFCHGARSIRAVVESTGTAPAFDPDMPSTELELPCPNCNTREWGFRYDAGFARTEFIPDCRKCFSPEYMLLVHFPIRPHFVCARCLARGTFSSVRS